MTEFDQNTALRMKLDPLIATCRADLDALTKLDHETGQELWNSSDDAAEVGKALARAIRMHEVNIEDAEEMIKRGYEDSPAFRKSAVELMRALGKVEASDFIDKINKVKPVAPKPKPKEIVIRLDKDYYKQLEKEKRAMKETETPEAPKLTEAEIEQLEAEKAALSRMLKAREPRRLEVAEPSAVDVKPHTPRPGLEQPDPASVILADAEVAKLEDQIRAEDKAFRENLDAEKKSAITRRALLVAQRDAAAAAARDAREAFEAESLAEAAARREEDALEAQAQAHEADEAQLVRVRDRIGPMLERSREAFSQMQALSTEHIGPLQQLGSLSTDAVPKNWLPNWRIEYIAKVLDPAQKLQQEILDWLRDVPDVFVEAEKVMAVWKDGPDHQLRINTLIKQFQQIDDHPRAYRKQILELSQIASGIERKAGISRRPVIEIIIERDSKRPEISQQMKEDMLRRGVVRPEQKSAIGSDSLFE